MKRNDNDVLFRLVNRDKTYVCVHMQTWMMRTGAVAGAGPIWSTARVRSPHALPSQLVVVLLGAGTQSCMHVRTPLLWASATGSLHCLISLGILCVLSPPRISTILASPCSSSATLSCNLSCSIVDGGYAVWVIVRRVPATRLFFVNTYVTRLFVEIRCYKSRRYPLDQMELI
jgi:hypothetical protein